MWLNDLEELVGKLRHRIYNHRDVLTRSESTTRYALVDPLLSALGWDLADPDQVLTECEASYKDDDNRHYADYVLFHGKKPCLVVEAKSLGTKLATGDRLDQSTKYCNRLGAQHFVLTDGDRWEARDKSDPRESIFEFDVTAPRTNVIELLWLWPGNFQGERAISVPTPTLSPFKEPAPTRPNAAPASLLLAPDQQPLRDSVQGGTYVTGEEALSVITGRPRDATYVYVGGYKEPKLDSIHHAIYDVIKGNQGTATGHFILESISSLNNGRGFKRPRTNNYMTDNDVAWQIRLLVQLERLHISPNDG